MNESRAQFIFLPLLAGNISSVQLTQWGPNNVEPGETFKLNCAAAGALVSYSSWSWVRQLPGKDLEWMGRIQTSGTTEYSPALCNQILITRDTYHNHVYLQLKSPRAADTAKYYCAKSTVMQSNGAAMQKPPNQSTDPSLLLPAGFREEGRIDSIHTSFQPSEVSPTLMPWSQISRWSHPYIPDSLQTPCHSPLPSPSSDHGVNHGLF